MTRQAEDLLQVCAGWVGSLIGLFCFYFVFILYKINSDIVSLLTYV